jgi:hypothetical protein
MVGGALCRWSDVGEVCGITVYIMITFTKKEEIFKELCHIYMY